MPTILKGALSAIAKRWKILACIFLSVGVAGWTVGRMFGIHFFFFVRRLLTPIFYTVVLLVATSAFLIVLLWLFPKWQVLSVAGLEPKERFDRENEARKTLSQILGGLVLLIGFYFTWQNLSTAQENLRIASEGQITERFTKAITQLGDTKLEIRLGGIYALERIANDSTKDHWPVMEVLTAYVREHTGDPQLKPLPASVEASPRPALDIQAILTVLGRRRGYFAAGPYSEPNRLDLHRANLTGADLVGSPAHLDGAILDDADLSKTVFIDTNFNGTHFKGATLRGADLGSAALTNACLDRADLTNANLKFANISGATFRRAILVRANLAGSQLFMADLSGANLTAADLTGADLSEADLTDVTGLQASQLESAKGDAKTKIPPAIPRPKSWQ